MGIMKKKKIEIFCCYAREDQELLLKLKKHLKPLERQGLITLWSDIDINGGMEWESEIKKHLNSAQIILLFVSSDFMQSDYCYSTEMSRAMERHGSGEACVIPIILRPILWHRAPFGKLQVLPTNAEPVTSRIWHTPDDAFLNVTEGIEKKIEELLNPLLIDILVTQPVNNNSKQKEVNNLEINAGEWQGEIFDEFTSREIFDKLTSRTKRVLALSQKEAWRLQHSYNTDIEHLLLGLLSIGEGIAANVLASFDIELNFLRNAVEAHGNLIVLDKTGLTSGAQRAIQFAAEEARLMKHRYIGTEHLLLGLVDEGKGVADLLADLGITLEDVRERTIQLLLDHNSFVLHFPL
jgi:Clp amino terminal domain, pathogenicity island component/TIR domain